VNRRSFITFVSGAALGWPFAARGQQPAMPMIGYLGSGEATATVADIFRRGLSEIGYEEGRNVAIEFRFAHGQYDQLPALAAELVRRRVSILVTSGAVHAALAAKAATATIPIVFGHGSDPVRFGLVASLNRPGGNITGITYLTTQLESKRLGLLHELVPQATAITVLVNPTNPNAQSQTKELVKRFQNSNHMGPAAKTRVFGPNRRLHMIRFMESVV
jgi:putative ABC transport system substrate-binding protein